jgi:hypothetical protein
VDELFAGKYRLIRRLPSGGGIDAFAGVEPDDGADVVVELLEARDRERFRSDMQALSSIEDPHLARVLDFGGAGDRVYVVREAVAGADLEIEAVTNGPLRAVAAARVGAQAAAGLAAIHARGLVHGSVRPERLTRQLDGTVRLVDAGLAAAVGPADLSELAPASAAAYVSPEEAMGRPVAPASDIYALGATLYRLVAGRPPFEGPNAEAVAQGHVGGLIRPLTRQTSGPSSELERVVARAMAKAPEDRYPTARAMRRDLQRVVAGAQVGMPKVSVEAGPQRRRWPWVAVALVAVAAIAGVLWATGAFSGSGSPTLSGSPSPAATVALVTVPNVQGMSQAAAGVAIGQAGLKLDRGVSVYSSTVPVGTVITQLPQAGVQVVSGSGVTLAVSVGPGPTSSPVPAVPNVVGAAKTDAIQALQSAGYAVVVYNEPSNTVPAGSVIAQSPSAGVLTTAGSSVAIAVSTGPSVTTTSSP